MKILIAYDGSADAQTAIETAGALFAGSPVVVLTVWEGFTDVVSRAGAGLAAAPLDFEEIDRANTRAAQERAEEGCGLARGAGLEPEPRNARQEGTVWQTILSQADAAGADAIVMGSRGLTGVRSLLLGSVSHAVLQHADRPVIVVPGAKVAHQRSQRLQRRTPTPAG